MPPFAKSVLPRERTTVVVLHRCLEFRERNALTQACLGTGDPGPQEVILDLSHLERINVVTISAILELHELLSESGRRVRLSGLTREVYEALRYLGLHWLIPIESRAAVAG